MQGFINFISAWVVPTLILLALLYAYFCKVNLFDTFVEGAKEGFEMSVKLIPFLVGMMVAIGLFRDSGAMELVSDALTPLLQLIGIPAEVLPLAFMRPVSGSSALAITTELIHSFGPDSLIGRMAATIQGSTDTTLFVLTVYFGAVGIRKTRHALAVGLLADVAGILAAVLVCNMVFS
ncbi:MAG: spore maturation protein [Dethiobacteria bacterium]